MSVHKLCRALVTMLGFSSLDHADLPEARLLQLERYAFVGLKNYWGSMLACGVLSVESEDAAEVALRADEFYALFEFTPQVRRPPWDTAGSLWLTTHWTSTLETAFDAAKGNYLSRAHECYRTGRWAWQRWRRAPFEKVLADVARATTGVAGEERRTVGDDGEF